MKLISVEKSTKPGKKLMAVFEQDNLVELFIMGENDAVLIFSKIFISFLLLFIILSIVDRV